MTYSVVYKDLGLTLPFFFQELVVSNPTRVCDLHVKLRQARHNRKILYIELAFSKVASIFRDIEKVIMDL